MSNATDYAGATDQAPAKKSFWESYGVYLGIRFAIYLGLFIAWLMCIGVLGVIFGDYNRVIDWMSIPLGLFLVGHGLLVGRQMPMFIFGLFWLAVNLSSFVTRMLGEPAGMMSLVGFCGFAASLVGLRLLWLYRRRS